MTFLNPRYEGLLWIDSVTCVIDAVGIFADGDNDRLNMLKLRQIGFADLVVLNKTDLVGTEHIEVIREWIGLHKEPVRIIETTYTNVPMEILLGAGRFDSEAVAVLLTEDTGGPQPHHSDDLDRMFDRWSYRTTAPFSLDALRHMVRRELPESVYRCKGIIYAADSPNTRLALQVVGGRMQIVDLDEWGDRQRLSEIIAIGSEIDRQHLGDLFDACLERHEPA
jgi:G3E family GTPase